MRLTALLVLLFVASASAQSLASVEQYAQQFENGEVSLLQLEILLSSEREKVFDELNKQRLEINIGEDHYSVWSEEAMRGLFGEPTDTERWAWSPIEDKSVRLAAPVPRWDKKLYEGNKVRVVFDSWPMLFQRGDKNIVFYNFDFRTEFKQDVDLNVQGEVAEIKALLETGRGNDAQLKEAATKAVQLERVLGDFLHSSEQTCKETLASWIGQSRGESSQLRWEATLYNGQNIGVFLHGDEWTESEWHGFSTWVEFQGDAPPEQEPELMEFDYASSAEYLAHLRSTLADLKRTAENFDRDNSPESARHGRRLARQFEELVRSFTDKVGRRELEISQDELVAEFEKIFAEQQDFKRENVRKVEYRQILVNVTEQRSSSYCNAVEQSCGQFEACANAACVSAKGGNEQCENNSDDDGDGLSDCDDPDCFDFIACGKKCEPVCSGENGCWQCGGEQCNRECDACGQCNENNPGNPGACNAVCDACGQCTQQKCAPRCEDCWECEDEYYGSGCRSECKQCEACNEAGGEDCEAECFSCNKCNYEKGNLRCEAPKVVNAQTYSCECPQTQCLPGQYLEWETCSCQGEAVEPPSEQEQREPAPVNQTREESADQPVVPQQDTSVVNNATTNFPQVTGKVTGLFALPYSLTSLEVAASFENSGPCGGACSANQYCASDKGWCECSQGFYECDGDWKNGCESTKQCTPCKSDSDCAPQRCSEDKLRVVDFRCVSGEGWFEEVAQAEFAGFCGQRNSGEFDSGAWISAWGEGFENFDRFKQIEQQKQDAVHCERELQQFKAQRLELQNSLNDGFLQWFFDQVVIENPNDFEAHMEKVWGIYNAFQRNSDETARALRCMGRSDWPEEYELIKVNLETEFGKIEIWEEKKRTSFWGVEQEIFSPYMKMWVFPPKSVFKRFFAEKIREEGPEGPTPEELAMMRRSPFVMQKIKKIADNFGGDARIIVQAVDEGEQLVRFIFIVNERDLVRIEPADDYSGPVSATISVSLDFIYDSASSFEKDMRGAEVIYPHWEHGQEPPRVLNQAVDMVKVFFRIFQGFTSGEITVEPPSALPAIVMTLQEMMSMMMQAP